MEGNPLMSIIKEAVLETLRTGDSVACVRQQLLEVMNELQAMEVYLKAIKEVGMRP
jgi:urease gamma subunit